MATLQGNQGQTGKSLGPNQTAGFGEFTDLLITELQARFYQQTVRNLVFTAGMQITSISAVGFTTADALSATLANAALSSPIVGIWNPANSGVNAVILQANVPLTITALQVTPPGPLVWVGFSGQTVAMSTATKTAVSRKTFAQAGAQCQNLSGVALTGLQNTGFMLGASAIPTYALDASTLQTAAGLMPPTGPAVENIDGSIIVQPGQILGLYASVTPVAVSAASSLLWYEVPTTV